MENRIELYRNNLIVSDSANFLEGHGKTVLGGAITLSLIPLTAAIVTANFWLSIGIPVAFFVGGAISRAISNHLYNRKLFTKINRLCNQLGVELSEKELKQLRTSTNSEEANFVMRIDKKDLRISLVAEEAPEDDDKIYTGHQDIKVEVDRVMRFRRAFHEATTMSRAIDGVEEKVNPEWIVPEDDSRGFRRGINSLVKKINSGDSKFAIDTGTTDMIQLFGDTDTLMFNSPLTQRKYRSIKELHFKELEARLEERMKAAQ